VCRFLNFAVSAKKHILIGFLVLSFSSLFAQDRNIEPGKDGSKRPIWSQRKDKSKEKGVRRKGQGKDRPVVPPKSAWPVASIILGRPGINTITVSILAAEDIEAFVEYGTVQSPYSLMTQVLVLKGIEPVSIILDNLATNTLYTYRLRYRKPGEEEFAQGPTYKFHTQRSSENPFTFTIQADSHLGTDKHCDPELYAQTLINVQFDKPDFHIDLGDTFRATKLREVNQTSIEQLFRDQRNYFGLVCHSAPLFLVLGNHDNEWGWDLNSSQESVSAKMTRARNKFYPNPIPGGIFTGNSIQEKTIGYPANYYAWQWGDGLFIVLDIYRHTTINPKAEGEPWDWTLGDEQYEWLRKTLSESRKPVKCVFLHHLHGASRGAKELADLYEWGGQDRKGRQMFKSKRPYWSMPVHELLVKYGVTAVFQGHDHIFASQDKDGVAYITCPMPGDPGYNAYNKDAFRIGETFPNSGHVRAGVRANSLTIEYIRAFLSKDETDKQKNAMVAFSRTIQIAKTKGK